MVNGEVKSNQVEINEKIANSDKYKEEYGNWLTGTIIKHINGRYYLIEKIKTLNGRNVKILCDENKVEKAYLSKTNKLLKNRHDDLILNSKVFFNYELSDRNYLFGVKNEIFFSEEEFIDYIQNQLINELANITDSSTVDLYNQINEAHNIIFSTDNAKKQLELEEEKNRLEQYNNNLKKQNKKLKSNFDELEEKCQKLSDVKREIEEDVRKKDLQVKELNDFFDEKEELFQSVFGVDSDLYREFTSKVLTDEREDTSFEDQMPANFLQYLENRFTQNEGGAMSQGFYFESSTITQFIRALCTRQFIILCGKSGTGKTSLVRLFAEEINGEYEIIPVQSSWMDRQDLLGTYDHINNQFYPATALVDTLISAEKNPQKLYIICFDEFNLSQPENYCADIFSLFETSQEPLISLYNSHNGIFGNHSMDEQSTIKVNTYPSNIKIPKNVRFVGTMNVDSSVIQLSPKVIDRSVIIRVDKADKATNSSEIEKMAKKSISATAFQIDVKGKSEIENINLDKYEMLAQSLRIEISSRSKDAITRAMLCPVLCDSSQTYDDMIATKILPMVNCVVEENLVKNTSNEISKLVEKESKSSKIFSEMKQKSKQNRILSYWSI